MQRCFLNEKLEIQHETIIFLKRMVISIMKEELEKLNKEFERDLEKIKIERENNLFDNLSNKPYWKLEKKYKEKAKKICKIE